MRLRSLFVIGLTAMVMLMSAIPLAAETPKYFVADSLRGTLSPNNPPSQAMFFSGEHNRTYVTYISDKFKTNITCYDHDTGQWAEPVEVDDVFWTDGHNCPELLISQDGYLHLFYGCHYSPIKYARSVHPEDIEHWFLGKKIGDKATYPHPVEIGRGEILVFYRWHLKDDYAVTAVQRSTDNGSTWDEPTQLVSFRNHPDEDRWSWAYQRVFAYDAADDVIYCALMESAKSGKTHYSVKYNPTTRHLIAMNGADLGTTATREHLDANECKRRQFFLNVGRRAVTLEPPQNLAGVWLHNFGMYTTDGVNIVGFGGRDGNVVLWKSTDAGQIWDEGQVIVPQSQLDGDNAGGSVAIVRNYSGSGPLVIFQGNALNASPEFVYRFEIRQKYNIRPIEMAWRQPPWYCNLYNWSHYHRPDRVGKRLYALDAQGNLLY